MTTSLSYSSKRGYILFVYELRRVLADISHGSRRWWIEDDIPIQCDEGEKFWLTIFHSSPIPGQMTDEISFDIPVLSSSPTPRTLESGLACLHPETVRTRMQGLYIENDRVFMDCLEDWALFWEPLEQALVSRLARKSR